MAIRQATQTASAVPVPSPFLGAYLALSRIAARLPHRKSADPFARLEKLAGAAGCDVKRLPDENGQRHALVFGPYLVSHLWIDERGMRMLVQGRKKAMPVTSLDEVVRAALEAPPLLDTGTKRGSSLFGKMVRRLGFRLSSVCYWCGLELDPCAQQTAANAIEVDHRIPCARGGSSDARNLVPACPACNRARGDAMPELSGDWVPPRLRPRTAQEVA